MRVGKVKFFDGRSNHFGYLLPFERGGVTAGRDIRVDEQDLRCPPKLPEGTFVVFDVVEVSGRNQAVNVRLLSKCNTREQASVILFLPHPERVVYAERLVRNGFLFDEFTKRSLLDQLTKVIERRSWALTKSIGNDEAVEKYLRSIDHSDEIGKSILLDNMDSAIPLNKYDRMLICSIANTWTINPINTTRTEVLLKLLISKKIDSGSVSAFVEMFKRQIQGLSLRAILDFMRYAPSPGVSRLGLSQCVIATDEEWGELVSFLNRHKLNRAEAWQVIREGLAKRTRRAPWNTKAKIGTWLRDNSGVQALAEYAEGVVEESSREKIIPIDSIVGYIRTVAATLPDDTLLTNIVSRMVELYRTRSCSGIQLLEVFKLAPSRKILQDIIEAWDVTKDNNRMLLEAVSDDVKRGSEAPYITQLLTRLEPQCVSPSVLNVLRIVGVETDIARHYVVIPFLLDASFNAHRVVIVELLKSQNVKVIGQYLITYLNSGPIFESSEWGAFLSFIETKLSKSLPKEAIEAINSFIYDWIGDHITSDYERLQLVNIRNDDVVLQLLVDGWEGNAVGSYNAELLSALLNCRLVGLRQESLGQLLLKMGKSVKLPEILRFILHAGHPTDLQKIFYDSFKRKDAILAISEMLRADYKIRNKILAYIESDHSESYAGVRDLLRLYLHDDQIVEVKGISYVVNNGYQIWQLFVLKKIIYQLHRKLITGEQFKGYVDSIQWTNLSCRLIVTYLRYGRSESKEMLNALNTCFKEHFQLLVRVNEEQESLEELFDVRSIVKACDGIKEYVHVPNGSGRHHNEDQAVQFDRELKTYKIRGDIKLISGEVKPIYCEGRFWKKQRFYEEQKKDFTTQEYEVFWCRNHVCFGVNQTANMRLPFIEWGLNEIGFVFNFGIDRLFYSTLAGYTNRLNEILLRLECRSCKAMLRPLAFEPKKLGYYAVPLFQCSRKDCAEYGMVIRFTHCLNGRCRELLDSRDQTTCTEDWMKCKCGTCCPKHSGIKSESPLVEGSWRQENKPI